MMERVGWLRDAWGEPGSEPEADLSRGEAKGKGSGCLGFRNWLGPAKVNGGKKMSYWRRARLAVIHF